MLTKRLRLDAILKITLVLASGLYWNHAFSAQVPGPLVEPDWLAHNIGNVVILDVRAPLAPSQKGATPIKVGINANAPGSRPHNTLRPSHAPFIAGARLLDYKKVRATRMIDKSLVKKMLPEKKVFEDLLRTAGVDQDSAIVIVTRGLTIKDVAMGTRLYWQLKYFGHDNVTILNGGMARWSREDRPIARSAYKSDRGNWTARVERQILSATSSEVAAAIDTKATRLIDARSARQYAGVTKPGYVYAHGYISGAKNYSSDLLVSQGGGLRFLSNAQYLKAMNLAGIDPYVPIMTYCNSGHHASALWFVISELLGNKNIALYDGSAHQWTLEDRRLVTAISAAAGI